MSWGQGEQERRLHGLVRIGTVTAVDPAAARARVILGGDAVSGWIPFTAIRAGGLNAWAPVTVGEQVVVVSPGGDTAQGVIVGSLPSGANGAPSGDGGEFRFEIGGSSISMTGDRVTMVSNGSVVEMTAGEVAITGDVTITGALAVNGSGVTHNGTNIGDDHVHGGITPGGANTLGPQ